MPKKNTTHKKAMFYLRAQCLRCVITYAKTLYEFANGGNFPSKNKEIKGRLKTQNKGLSECFQFTLDLKLDKALEMVRSYEQIRTQMKERQTKNVDRIQMKISEIFSGQNQKCGRYNQLMTFYHSGFSDYYLHLYCYIHVSDNMFFELGSLHGTSNHVFYLIHRGRL